MTFYILFILFALTVCGYGFVEMIREDRQRQGSRPANLGDDR